MSRHARRLPDGAIAPAPDPEEIPDETTPVALATLRIGVHVPDSATYFEDDRAKDREDFEETVWTELNANIASPVWTIWESVPLPQTHPTESQVREAIVQALRANNNHPQKKTMLSLSEGNTTAAPTSVRYVWRDGKFVRVHSYALDRGSAGQNWLIEHDPPSGDPTVTVHLQARLHWRTDA